MPNEKRILTNGLNGETGQLLLPPLSPSTLSEIAGGKVADPSLDADLRAKKRSGDKHLGPIAGVDAKDLGSSGWAVVFPANIRPGIVEALKPLLDHRRAQVSAKNEKLYRECAGPEFGYVPGERKVQFLRKNGAPGSGSVDPEELPYYLLLVGGPEDIPFSLQYQLDVQYAVGRIQFDKDEDYSAYAHSVIAAETGNRPPKVKRAAFFATSNPEDQITSLSSGSLTQPLADYFEKFSSAWAVTKDIGAAATRSRLHSLLGGADEPSADFLFAACHGAGFSPGSFRQRTHTGALVCQDWPGRKWDGPLRDFYIAAEDISSNANLAGSIAMLFACYSAGMPQFDDFNYVDGLGFPRSEVADQPFVAELPKRMLAHPKGGALAVIGHVDRAWDWSFSAGGAKAELGTFKSTIQLLLDGYPVGAAMEHFNARYAELSTVLSAELEDIEYGKQLDEEYLSGLWCANNDARNYMVIGDPAVRLT